MQLNFSTSPVAQRFYQSDGVFDLISGGIGTGKTTAALARIYRHVLAQQPGPDGVARSKWLIVRNTFRQLEDTTIPTFLQMFPPSQFGTWHATANEYEWEWQHPHQPWRVSALFLFRPLDRPGDADNLLSLEVSGIYFNELPEISQTIVAQARGRTGRYPSAALGGCTWHGVVADCNPFSTEHYLHTLFVREKPPEFGYFAQPSGLSAEAENLSALNQTPESMRLPWGHPERVALGREYYRRLIATYTEEEARRFIHGEHVSMRGDRAVYSDFRRLSHVKEFELDLRYPLIVGCDPGLASAIVVGNRTPSGFRVAHEIVSFELQFDEVLAELSRLLETPAYRGYVRVETFCIDPAGNNRSGTTRDTFVTMARKAGYPVILSPCRNNLPVRIGAVNAAFRADPNGRDGIQIHPRCTALVAACEGDYAFRKVRTTSGKDRWTELPESKGESSHVAEALAYLISGGGGLGAFTGGAGQGSMTQEQFTNACANRPQASWEIFNG